MTTMTRRQQLISSLRDREYRTEWAADHTGVAFQIRAMRAKRGWSQEELARRVGMAQERISRLEDANYGRYSLRTLKRLAAAFDVALIVRFAPFSAAVDHLAGLSPDDLYVPPFDDDPGLTP
jgi:transcriptional regulator with XRE-family HTH domain